MRLAGILRSWNDDRGFGFVAPTHGGAEIFVHISSFPSDGSRPVAGESITYELGRGQNGKPQAVCVIRQAIGNRAPRQHATTRRSDAGRTLRHVVSAVLVLVCLAYAYNRLTGTAKLAPPTVASEVVESPRSPSVAGFRCDGRTYCSQMTSCAEATWFLKNCPGVKMDGNHDGIPCEQQWCK